MKAFWWVSMGVVLAGCGDNTRLLDAGTDLGMSADLGSSGDALIIADTGTDAGAHTADTGTDAGAHTADTGTDAGPDAGSHTTDAGPDAGSHTTDTGTDAGPDAGSHTTDAGPDAGSHTTDAGPDAGSHTTDAGTDAGPTADAGARGTPVIDGELGADWPTGALIERNATASTWGPTLNALRSLRVAWDSSNLYLGIEGTVEAMNAIVVYLDRDFIAGTTATGITRIDSLTDGTGALDDALSCGIGTMPQGLGIDLAWGTFGMNSKTTMELRPEVGLRDISCTACQGNFHWLAGDQVACRTTGASAGCEVSIPWQTIYPTSPPPIPRLGLFVRLTNRTGSDLSNQQTLPEQSPPNPTTVTRVLSFSPNL